MHPHPRAPRGRAHFKTLVAAVLVLVLFRHRVTAAAASGPTAVPITGIAGVVFLTNDFPGLRAFYGQGAGFAEQDEPGRIRFRVGPRQWLDFEQSPRATWERRMQRLVLETDDMAGLETALRERGVAAARVTREGAAAGVQFSDPAGNVIQVVSSARRASGDAPPPAFSHHLQHVGFAVPASLRDATIAFYRDRLGFAEGFRLNGADGQLALQKFKLPGAGRELIELIFVTPPQNRWAAGAADHVDFEVGDIDQAYQLLHRGGIATQGRHLPTVNAEHLWAIDLFDPELTRMEVQVTAPTTVPPGTVSNVGGESARPLFDGRTLDGWEGNLATWRVEEGAIVAGALNRRQPYNEFLATTRDYGDFELRLQYKVEGSNGFVNGGVQFWSQRVPASTEVCGYQADLGAEKDGDLYDESRRNADLADPKPEVRTRALKAGTWNDYRVRAQGGHIELWLNGVKTVDYTEPDPAIPRRGKFALQIHGYAQTKVWYRGLELEELPPKPPGRAGN